MDLLIRKCYYRNKNIALVKAGEKEAELKFVTKVAQKLFKSAGMGEYEQCNFKAKIIIQKAMNARLKCVAFLKKQIGILQEECQQYLDKAEEAGEEATLEDVCGASGHSNAREPYFYEAAYEVHTMEKHGVLVPSEPCSDHQSSQQSSQTQSSQSSHRRRRKKPKPKPPSTRMCQPNCVLPENALKRLSTVCKRLMAQRMFRRVLANIDQCKNRRHIDKCDTIGPQEAAMYGEADTNYKVKPIEKLGHEIVCLPENCDSELLFLRRLSVHFPEIARLLRILYKAKSLDAQLHAIDTALVKADLAALEAITNPAKPDNIAVAAAPDISCTQSQEGAPEMRIYSLKYAIEFLKDIHKHPVHSCVSCRRLNYRHDVRQVMFEEESDGLKIYTGCNTERKNAEKACTSIWLDLFGVLKAEELEGERKVDWEELFICHRCFSAATGGNSKKRARDGSLQHESISIFNKMKVPETPEELKHLNDFEKQFIQRAKCFQTIYSLGTIQSKLPSTHKVKAHKGQVVHYPLPLSETFRQLPKPGHMPNEENLFIMLFGVPTKKKIIWKALVDVDKVNAALRKLKEINPEYEDIPDFWDPLNEAEWLTDEGEPDDEVLRECQRFAKHQSLITKIDQEEEKRLIDSYTVRPVFDKKSSESDVDLYKMERVQAERIDTREPKLDLWSFPHLYPDGKYGEGEEREIPVTPHDFVTSRLMNENPKFRQDQQYLFYLLHKYYLRSLASSISQSLRMTTGYDNMTTGQFVDRVAQGDQDLNANLTTAFSSIRGSSGYWGQQRKDLRTMVDQLGPPTWFLTLSAAEYDWQDMQELLDAVNKQVEGHSRMATGEKCAADPVMTSKHLHKRFLAFFKNVIMDKDGPLGEVVDFFWRCEYQARGTPHFHMVLWVKDAPRIGIDDEQTVLNFILQHATCRLPDKEKEPLLHKYVTKYQAHTCNSYCLKCRGKCRFGFPRPATPVGILNSDPLKNVGRRLRGKAERLYSLPRQKSEERINDYVPEILLLWESNMDIQFCGESTHAIVNYIVDYITKKERANLQDLWDNLRSDKSTWSRLFHIGCRALDTRECGAYEAVDLLLGHNLYGKSRQVKYINARKPEFRTKLLKKLSALREMDPGSTDKYENSWIGTYYPDRPDGMEEMCLFDFMRLHDKMSNWIEGEFAFKTPAHGTLIRRNKPYLISHPALNPDERPEEYYYALLLLFKHFRNEEELIDADTQSSAAIYLIERLTNEKMVEFEEKIAARAEQAKKNQERIEAERNKPPTQPNSQIDEEPQMMDVPNEPALAMEELDALMHQVPTDETYEENLAKMNPGQLRVFNDIREKLEKDEGQLLAFISGAGGVGKSFVIRTLQLWARQHYAQQDTALVISAPTGLAAFNVQGMTLHKLFQLPVQHNLDARYTELPEDTRKQLHNQLKHLKVVVIDEISMVSNKTLAYIHLRLNEIFRPGPDYIPFGGKNIIALGDLAQLPPVGDLAVFRSMNSKQLRSIGGFAAPDLWSGFSFYELTENMRQAGDDEYASILNRLRFGQLDVNDVKVLQSRLTENPEATDRLDAICQKYKALQENYPKLLCLLALQKMVKEFNNAMLNLEESEIVEIAAIDEFDLEGRRRASKKDIAKAKEILQKVSERGDNDTAGVDANIRLCVGARVMLVRNIEVEKGLVNGATGRVTRFVPNAKTREIELIGVKFDSIEQEQEISRNMVRFQLTNQIYVNRSQFCLTPAYAITIHKSQGISVDQIMVDAGNSIFRGKAGAGMTYVALSRVRSLNGLHLINFDPSLAKASPECVKEINRLRGSAHRGPEPFVPLPEKNKLHKKVRDEPWCKSLGVPLMQPNILPEESAPAEKTAKGKKPRQSSKRKAPEKEKGPAPKRAKKGQQEPKVQKPPAAKEKSVPPTPQVQKPPRRTRNEKRKGDSAGDPIEIPDQEIPSVAPKPPKSGKITSDETAPNQSRREQTTEDYREVPNLLAGISGLQNVRVLKPPGLSNPPVVVDKGRPPRSINCYANAAMQALMSLEYFRNKCRSFQLSNDPMQRALFDFYEQYQLREASSKPPSKDPFEDDLTRPLRLAVTGDGTFHFADKDGEADSEEFLRSIIDTSGMLDDFLVQARDCFLCTHQQCFHTWASAPEVTADLAVMPRIGASLDQLLDEGPVREAERMCVECMVYNFVDRTRMLVAVPDQFVLKFPRKSFQNADKANNEPVNRFDPNQQKVGNKMYRTVAAIEHIGEGRSGGHYVAYVRRGDVWYRCNDSSVKKDKLPFGLRQVLALIMEKVPELSQSQEF